MSFVHLLAGRGLAVFGVAAAVLLVCGVNLAGAGDQFPFDRDLLLDAAPMRPAKRVPLLSISENGQATIGLWCKTVAGRATIADKEIRIEAGPLPDALPQYTSDGQCTPERMQADADLLATIVQMTTWKRQGDGVLLSGPRTLRFFASSH